MDAEKKIIDLTKPSSGGGGGGTDDYTDLTNKPQINSTTLSGNKSSSDLGLQDALVSGTNIKTINNTSLLGSGDITVGGGDYTAGTGLQLNDSAFDILQEDYGVDATPINHGCTITDSVYSGFSTSNYAYLNSTLNCSTSDDFEIVLKLKHASAESTSTKRYFISMVSNNENVSIWKDAANRLSFSIGSTRLVTFQAPAAYPTNTWVWYRLTKTVSNGTTTLTLAYSTDGTNWTTGDTQTATAFALEATPIYFGISGSLTLPMNGSIDINGCYIKINGQYWWNPAQSTYKPVAKATSSLYGLVKPDNSTITVADGVISATPTACTTITASNTTATITANSTYNCTPTSSGITFTITSPTESNVYAGFILMLNTQNSASVAFQTNDATPISVIVSGNPNLEVGKSYTVTGQLNPTTSSWELWVIEYKAN